MSQFSQYELNPNFDKYFNDLGFLRPTQTQEKVIPVILKRKSVKVLAETGSGKTLSYAIPIIELLKRSEAKGNLTTDTGTPMVVVVSPTRELATQIAQVFKELSHHLKFRVRVLTGGTTKAKMVTASHTLIDVLITTPNRLRSAMVRKEIKLHRLQWLVFDEADQLFDMGFKKDMDFIVQDLDHTSTRLGFFSATLPYEIDAYLLEKFPNQQFEVISQKSSHAPQMSIETYNVKALVQEKDALVRMFLDKKMSGRGIIFTNQKNQAENLYKFIKEKCPQLKTTLIHGDLTSDKRSVAMKDFKDKKYQVLVSTDIFARGMDIEDLVWVLNYGLPKTAIYYLHRCGRVGRGGRKGLVYNLVAPHDAKMIGAINDAIKNQKHLPLTVLPERKLSFKQDVEKKVEKKEKEPLSFRGKSHGKVARKPKKQIKRRR